MDKETESIDDDASDVEIVQRLLDVQKSLNEMRKRTRVLKEEAATLKRKIGRSQRRRKVKEINCK